MDYAALKAEIGNAAYAGMTDTQIVDVLNASMAGPSVPTPVASILGYLRSNGLWLPIKTSALSSSPNPGATAALDIFQDGHTTELDLTLPAAQMLLASLVSGSLLTSAQASALTALCQTTTSIAASFGFTNGVTVDELAAARIWPGVHS